MASLRSARVDRGNGRQGLAEAGAYKLGKGKFHAGPSSENATAPGLRVPWALCKLSKQQLRMVDLVSIKLY